MYFIISAVIVFIDQLTKHYTVKYLYNNITFPIINNFLEFTFVKNKGAAFGIFQDQTILFVIITVAVSIALIFLLIKIQGQFIAKLSLSLILGGAIGNLLDRVRLGYVVDFIHITHWPVFNVADMCIVVGSILLAVCVFFSEKSKE